MFTNLNFTQKPIYYTLVLLLLCASSQILSKDSYSKLDYKARPHLITKAEIRYLRQLEAVLPNQYRVFAQVRVADVILPRLDKQHNDKLWWQHFRKISAKHLDFVIVDAKTFKTIVAIELNDKSHLRADRKKRDEFLISAFKTAKVPLVWQWVKRKYTEKAIKNSLETYINFKQ